MRHPAYLTVDLGYGDSGKGRIVDELVRTTGAGLVVRHSGGPQCGHNVVLADGRHHCFAQIGSGTFAGAATYYSRFALLEPFALINEARVLQSKLGSDPLKRFFVEEGTPVITPFHWMANRLKERARGTGRHGSCGMGVGELRQDMEDRQPFITAGELQRHCVHSVYDKLVYIRALKCDQLKATGIDPASLMAESLFSLGYFYERFAGKVQLVKNGTLAQMIDGPIVCENAQGVLIDERFGFAPHCSWTDVTFGGAMRLLDGLPVDVSRIGILRSYATRHGAGPFPSESAFVNHAEPHNALGEWQGAFRQGDFDAVTTRYALRSVGGIDGLALTHLDRTDRGIMNIVTKYSDRAEISFRTIGQDLMGTVASSTERIHYRDLAAHLGVEITMETSMPFCQRERVA
jgi:adenylosuccinate synthase